MSKTKSIENDLLYELWHKEDNLILLEGMARDGYPLEDIARRIGIEVQTLKRWIKASPDIEEAIMTNREIVDYKVENALIKSALGYKTKELKITTTLNKKGEVVETVKEKLIREEKPNVSAIQTWLYNRQPNKWKNMNSRANIIDDIEEDSSIEIKVTRAKKNELENNEEWQDEINDSVKIRKRTKEEIKELNKMKKESEK